MAVTSGTLDLEEGGTSWRPAMEFYCKRKGYWLGSLGIEEGMSLQGMS